MSDEGDRSIRERIMKILEGEITKYNALTPEEKRRREIERDRVVIDYIRKIDEGRKRVLHEMFGVYFG